MIDKDVIYKHLRELERVSRSLAALQIYSLEEICSDFKKQWEIEHGLQLATQNLVDIGSHILSALGKNRCEDYTEVIDRLGSEGIIPPDFAKRIQGMAGLRNILVHDYLEIDLKKIYGILQNQLTDFDAFRRYITVFLTKTS